MGVVQPTCCTCSSTSSGSCIRSCIYADKKHARLHMLHTHCHLSRLHLALHHCKLTIGCLCRYQSLATKSSGKHTFVRPLRAVCLAPATRPESVRLLKISVCHVDNKVGYVDWGPFGNAVSPNHHVFVSFSAQHHDASSVFAFAGWSLGSCCSLLAECIHRLTQALQTKATSGNMAATICSKQEL